MPMKHIRKGISKRGSMTRAYSAGAEKIADNMYLDCRTEDYHIKYGITKEDCRKFAKLLIKAINTVCPGPLNTMSYLQQLASYEIGKYEKFEDGEIATKKYQKLRKEFVELVIAIRTKKRDNKVITNDELDRLDNLKSQMNNMETRLVYGNGRDKLRWRTPSKFPVTYLCYTEREEKVVGTISGFTKNNKKAQINHVGKFPTKQPDMRGFMCGISPNFVHSMDASHMALTIDKYDGAFGAVHDSFSTHACDVEELLALTKETFIEIYNVRNFYNYIQRQLISNDVNLDIDQPNRGSLNVEDIYQSDYFFA